MPNGIERNPPDPTYTCAVRMERKGEYINKKRNMKKGSEQKKKEKRTDIRKEGERKSSKKSVALITEKEIHCTNFKPLTFLRVTFWEGRPELT